LGLVQDCLDTERGTRHKIREGLFRKEKEKTGVLLGEASNEVSYSARGKRKQKMGSGWKLLRFGVNIQGQLSGKRGGSTERLNNTNTGSGENSKKSRTA